MDSKFSNCRLLRLKDDPTTEYNNNKNLAIRDSFGPYNFSNTDLNVMIAMERQNYSYFTDPTVFYVTASLSTVRNILSASGQLEQQIKTTPIEIDLCHNYYTNFDIIEQNFYIPLNTFYCPKPNAASIQGYPGADVYSSFSINFHKCKNSTSNNNHCKSEEEIANTIQSAFITYKTTKYQQNQTNFADPYIRLFGSNYNIINSDLRIENFITLEAQEMQSDVGMIFQDHRVHDAFDYNEQIFYSLTNTDNFASFVFKGSNMATVYLRSYDKLQNVVTQIGGFIQFISMVASYATQFVIKSYFFLYYYKHVFNEKHFNVENRTLESQANLRSINLSGDNISKIARVNSCVLDTNPNVMTNNFVKISKQTIEKIAHKKLTLPTKLNHKLCGFLIDSICTCKKTRH